MVWLWLACTSSGGLDDTGASTSDTGTSTSDTSDTNTGASDTTMRCTDLPTVWEVGPGHPYETPLDVPWETLAAGTCVRIHGGPYAAKWVVNAAGTEDLPIWIQGVDRPVITGDGAETPQALDYWNEDRSILKLGGSSVPAHGAPAWIVVEGLVLRSARPGYAYTDDRGQPGSYSDNAACLHVESGSQLVLLDNVLHDCGNGLFVSGSASDVQLLHNHLYDNGIEGSAYEHNSYTEALGILFEGNRYGPLREGCDGNNLKDRSAGTVIRSNWIEGGNRQLDLVDSGTAELLADGRYSTTVVSGNVLVEPDGAGNSQIVHYGGDSGDTSRYRQGTLHFVHNTVVSTRSGNTTLVRLSTDGEHADIRNNVVVASSLAIAAEHGTAELSDNYLPSGWRSSFDGGFTGHVSNLGGLEGDEPNLDGEHRPTADSPFLDAAGESPVGAPTTQYVPHQATEPRPSTEDIGAYEH